MGLHAPVLQSAALPYRSLPDGTVEVLLVATTHAQRWSLPKGGIAVGHTSASSAAKEAFEEGGVIGTIAPGAAGRFRAMKRSHCHRHLIDVCVHLLRVTQTLTEWPEMGWRQRRWFPAARAAELVNQPLVADLCRRLAA